MSGHFNACSYKMAATRVSLLAVFSVVLSPVWAGETIPFTRQDVHMLSEGEWMVEFFAPWCPACQAFGSTWARFTEWSQGKDVRVVQVDVDAEVGLSAQFIITALPSVYHIVDGEVRKMEFARSYDDLVSYVEDELWMKTDPVPWWKSPLSLHFQLLGKLVDVTKFAKSAYETLTQEYGYSNMSVFAMTIVATILVGFGLGAILVGCSELCGKLCGRRGKKERSKKEKSKEERSKEEPSSTPTSADREEEGGTKEERDGEGEETGRRPPEELLPTSTVGQPSSDTSSAATSGSTRRRQPVRIEYEEGSGAPKDPGAASKKKSPRQSGSKKRMKAEQ